MFNGCERLVWLFLVPQAPYAALSKSGLSLFIRRSPPIHYADHRPAADRALVRRTPRRAICCVWLRCRPVVSCLQVPRHRQNLLLWAQAEALGWGLAGAVGLPPPLPSGCLICSGLSQPWAVDLHLTAWQLCRDFWQLCVSHVPIFSFLNCRKLMILLASWVLFVFFFCLEVTAFWWMCYVRADWLNMAGNENIFSNTGLGCQPKYSWINPEEWQGA